MSWFCQVKELLGAKHCSFLTYNFLFLLIAEVYGEGQRGNSERREGFCCLIAGIRSENCLSRLSHLLVFTLANLLWCIFQAC